MDTMIILEPIEIYYGIESIIITIITTIISIKIILKYFEYKHKNLIFIGIAVFGLSSRAWPITTTFIFILLSQNPILPEFYLMIGHGIPFGIISWMVGWVLMTEMKIKTKKLILIPFLLGELVYLIFFYINLFFNISLIGTYIPVYFERVGLIIIIHSYCVTLILLITLIKLFIDTRKTYNKEIRLKGLLIISGMICMFLARQLNYLFSSEIFYSIFLLLGIVLIYHGVTFPKWLKKRIMKKEISSIENS